jgi:8-oxo-dGTP diphosphatase
VSHLRPHTHTCAGVLFTDPTGQPMLVKPIYKDGWEIPGGVVDAEHGAHRIA